MQYINIQTNEYPIYEAQVRAAFPNVSFPQPFNPPAPFSEVQPTTPPAYDTKTHKLVEQAPIQNDDQWVQVWEVVPLTPQEINDAVTSRRNGMSVKTVQARLVLLDYPSPDPAFPTMLQYVEACFNALPEPDKSRAKTRWKYGTTISRTEPLVLQMQQILGLTDEQLDSMFAFAAQL